MDNGEERIKEGGGDMTESKNEEGVLNGIDWMVKCEKAFV